MAEQMPQEGENVQEQIQSLAGELGPLIQRMQSAEKPEDKVALIKQILELLGKIKALFAAAGQEEQFYNSQFGEIEMQMQQAMGQMEG
jgi:hypothetical protein